MSTSTRIVTFCVVICVMNVGLGMSYGPLTALFAELFPVRVRYSGVSIGYALGAVLGGAFAPLISELLVQRTDTGVSIALYMMVLTAISFVAVTMVGETRGTDLGVDADDSPSAERTPA